MKFKTNLVIGLIFAGLLAFVYFYEIRGGEERRQQAQKAKELLSFKDSEARRLLIARGDSMAVLEKREGGWALTAPVSSLADQEAVERYLRNLRESERERVIADSAALVADPGMAARYGLGAPRLKVLLETEAGAADTLRFGNDSPTDRFIYVQQSGANPEIFAVRAWRFDNLDKSVFDLRDRRVLAFDTDQVARLSLMRPGGEEVALEKEEGVWRLQRPVQALAAGSEVDALLNQLKSAEAEAFVAEEAGGGALEAYGLAGQIELELSVLVGADRAEKRLRIGREDGQGHYYARDMSRPQVFLVDSTLVQGIDKGADELRDRKPLKFTRDAINRIEWTNSVGERIAADKDTAGVWNLAAPAGRQAKSWKINSLLGDLEQLEAEDFPPAMPAGIAEKLQVRLLSDGEVALEARFAGDDGGGAAYLQVGGESAVYRIAAADVADLDLRVEDVAQPARAEAEGADGQ